MPRHKSKPVRKKRRNVADVNLQHESRKETELGQITELEGNTKETETKTNEEKEMISQQEQQKIELDQVIELEGDTDEQDEKTTENENTIHLKTLRFKCKVLFGGTITHDDMCRILEGNDAGYYKIVRSTSVVVLCPETLPEFNAFECVCLGKLTREKQISLRVCTEGELEIRVPVKGTTNSVYVNPFLTVSRRDFNYGTLSLMTVLLAAIFPQMIPERMQKTVCYLRCRHAGELSLVNWWKDDVRFKFMQEIHDQYRKVLIELEEKEMKRAEKEDENTTEICNLTDIKKLYNILISERAKTSSSMTSNRVRNGNFILRPYQCRALKWMIERETTALNWYIPKLWYRVPESPDLVFNFDANVMLKYEDPPKFELRGGILADEMGLGKTVEFVALILTRPHPRRDEILRAASKLTTKEEEVATDVEEMDTDEQIQVIELQHRDFTFGSSLSLDSNTIDDDVDLSSVAPKDFHCDMCERSDAPDSEPNIFCSTCKSWFHSTCCGGMSMLGNDFQCSFCCESVPQNPMDSIGTLIVAPESIVLQWQEEFERHVRIRTLKMGMYPGVTNLRKKIRNRSEGWKECAKFFNAKYLASLDVMFCTYVVVVFFERTLIFFLKSHAQMNTLLKYTDTKHSRKIFAISISTSRKHDLEEKNRDIDTPHHPF